MTGAQASSLAGQSLVAALQARGLQLQSKAAADYQRTISLLPILLILLILSINMFLDRETN